MDCVTLNLHLAYLVVQKYMGITVKITASLININKEVCMLIIKIW